MRKKLGQVIRNARRSVDLTQTELGKRLGLKGSAIYRWETDESAPTRRHQRALVVAIQAVRPGAEAPLAAAFAALRTKEGSAPAATVPQALPTSPTPTADVLELAVLRMADELDLPARRLRRPLLRLLARLREGQFALDSAEQQIERWVSELN